MYDPYGDDEEEIEETEEEKLIDEETVKNTIYNNALSWKHGEDEETEEIVQEEEVFDQNTSSKDKKNQKINPLMKISDPLHFDIVLTIRTSVSSTLKRNIPPEPLDSEFTASKSYKISTKGEISFVIKDFCPTIFHRLRILNKIIPENYMWVISNDFGEKTFIDEDGTKFSFFLSYQKLFIIQLITAQESKNFRKNLLEYYKYVKEKSSTSPTQLSRFYGLHRVTRNSKKYYFTVFENPLSSFPPENWLFWKSTGWKQIKKMRGVPRFERREYLLESTHPSISLSEKIKNPILQSLESDSKFMMEKRLHHFHVLIGFSDKSPHLSVSYDSVSKNIADISDSNSSPNLKFSGGSLNTSGTGILNISLGNKHLNKGSKMLSLRSKTRTKTISCDTSFYPVPSVKSSSLECLNEELNSSENERLKEKDLASASTSTIEEELYERDELSSSSSSSSSLPSSPHLTSKYLHPVYRTRSSGSCEDKSLSHHGSLTDSSNKNLGRFVFFAEDQKKKPKLKTRSSSSSSSSSSNLPTLSPSGSCSSLSLSSPSVPPAVLKSLLKQNNRPNRSHSDFMLEPLRTTRHSFDREVPSTKEFNETEDMVVMIFNIFAQSRKSSSGSLLRSLAKVKMARDSSDNVERSALKFVKMFKDSLK